MCVCVNNYETQWWIWVKFNFECFVYALTAVPIAIHYVCIFINPVFFKIYHVKIVMKKIKFIFIGLKETL